MRERNVGSVLLALLSKPFSSPRLAALETLRFADFRYLLLTQVFSVMANESRLMAQAWLILTLTNSDAWVGATAGLPALIAAATALLGGVLADRIERRRMMVAINLALAAVALITAFLIATATVQLWQMVALAFLIAILSVSHGTAGFSIVGDIIPRAQLFGANALYSAAANLAIVIGPALAGIFLAQIGVEYAFYFSTLLYIASAVTATRIRVKVQRHGEGKAVTTIWQDLQGGIHYVAQTPALQWLLILGLSAIAVGVWYALVPRFARDFLESGATGYGAILSARGFGGLVGVITLIMGSRGKHLAPVLLACALGFALLVVAFAFSSTMTWAIIFAFGLGIVFIWWPSALRTSFQLSATDEMRGRVMSLFALVGQILTLGWFVGGVLSEAMGPRSALLLVAIFCVAINVLAYISSPALRAIGHDEE